MNRHPFANLSVADRGRIVAFHQNELSNAQITRIIGCSQNTVSLWVKKFEVGELNNLKDHRKGNRRPNKTTPEQDAQLVAAVDRHPFNAAVTVIPETNIEISLTTVRRRLNAANVHSHPAAQKIELKPEHRLKRVQFAREHLNMSEEEWKTVIWMDEKVFSTSEEGRYRVWRPKGERLNPKYVLPSSHSGRIVLGFWGSMIANRLLDLVEISSRMNAEEYVQILEEVLKPRTRQIYPEDQYPIIKIVQDNSSVHTSRLVRTWFEVNPGFQPIVWPPKSPDLNVIKNYFRNRNL